MRTAVHTIFSPPHALLTALQPHPSRGTQVDDLAVDAELYKLTNPFGSLGIKSLFSPQGVELRELREQSDAFEQRAQHAFVQHAAPAQRERYVLKNDICANSSAYRGAKKSRAKRHAKRHARAQFVE